jgi:DNA-binding MarR family transcriptional regulator
MRRDQLVAEVLAALRENNTAAVLFHGAVAARFGLSASDRKALDLLQRLGPLTAGQIAERTALAAASVTSLIDRLARKRLVSRRRDPPDHRRVIVALKPGVERRFASAFASLHRLTMRQIQRYRDDDLRVIHSFLTAAARAARRRYDRQCTLYRP